MRNIDFGAESTTGTSQGVEWRYDGGSLGSGFIVFDITSQVSGETHRAYWNAQPGIPLAEQVAEQLAGRLARWLTEPAGAVEREAADFMTRMAADAAIYGWN